MLDSRHHSAAHSLLLFRVKMLPCCAITANSDCCICEGRTRFRIYQNCPDHVLGGEQLRHVIVGQPYRSAIGEGSYGWVRDDVIDIFYPDSDHYGFVVAEATVYFNFWFEGENRQWTNLYDFV